MFKVVILSIGFFDFMNLVASESAYQKEKFKVLSFNIDTNIGITEEGYARDSNSEWRISARMPKIQKSLKAIIDQDSPDVIQLQEGRKFITKFGDEVDSITPLIEFLYEQGYQVSSKQLAPSERAFSYITAIKSKYTIDGEQSFYVSQTPDKPTDHSLALDVIKKHNYGEEWERCVYVALFHDAQGRKYRVRNVHFGFSEEHRKEGCKLLVKDSQSAFDADPNVLEVTTGDFNSFPDWGGPAQLEIMRSSARLQEVSACLKLRNGKLFKASFIAFPHDFAADAKRLNDEWKSKFGQTLTAALLTMNLQERKAAMGEIFSKECKAICSQLDHVYQQGFINASATLLPTPQFADFDHEDVTEEKVKSYIMRHYHQGPAFASDHQPILVECELPEKK